jgi:hypothetical protein
MRKYLLLLFILFANKTFAQFPPPAGEPETTAMHRDSSAFIDWATGCNVIRGLQDISDPSFGFATLGEPSMATGKTAGVVSLGDGGEAILTFAFPIFNGPGWDFAVFENGFDEFLELAFVEVSSDGENFFRFPSISLTDTNIQIDNNGGVKASQINNLAGKYVLGFGTPFDLEELKDIPGLDINNITHIKIIDVVGSLHNEFATRDSEGRKINDPWPTPFPSSGFDLNAVGLIHTYGTSGIASDLKMSAKIFPNPAKKNIFIQLPSNDSERFDLTIMDLSGNKHLELIGISNKNQNKLNVDISSIPAGFYFIKVAGSDFSSTKQLIISK